MPAATDAAVECSPSAFGWAWVGIVLTHVVIGLSLLTVAATVQLLMLPDFEVIAMSLQILGLHLDSVAMQTFAVIGGMLAMLHLGAACRLVFRSIKAQEFAFRVPAGSRNRAGLASRWCGVSSVVRAVISPLRAIGIRGRYFEVAFIVRELFEISTQTLQGYRNSKYVARAWYNQYSMIVLVLNCWSSPCVHWFGCRWQLRVIAVHLLCLVVDLVLDVMMAFVLPYFIGLSYFSYMLSDTDQVATHEDPILAVQAKSELIIVVPASWLAVTVQLVPSATMLQALMDIALILRKRCSSRSKRILISVAPAVNAPEIDQKHVLNAAVQQDPKSHTGNRLFRYSPLKKMLDIVFLCWGIVIVVLYGSSTSSSAMIGGSAVCQLQLQPWLSTQITCGVIVVDCHHLTINGSATEIGHFLEQFDMNEIGSLTIAHCPALSLPSSLTRMNSILIIEMFNCSLVSWGLEAAITKASHPQIYEILLDHVNLDAVGNTLPAALMTDNIPPSLSALYVASTNLSAMSPDFPSKWNQAMVSLAIIDCQLSILPPTMKTMQISLAFSATRNHQLATVPMPPLGTAQHVILNDDWAVELPKNVTNVPATWLTQSLMIQNTTVSAIPQWLLDTGIMDVWAWNSPLCFNQSSRAIQQTLVHCERSDAFNFETWPMQRGLVLSN